MMISCELKFVGILTVIKISGQTQCIFLSVVSGYRQRTVRTTQSLLNCTSITEILQATEGHKYFPRGPHVGQPFYTASDKTINEWWIGQYVEETVA
jgi:hypothetical protein